MLMVRFQTVYYILIISYLRKISSYFTRRPGAEGSGSSKAHNVFAVEIELWSHAASAIILWWFRSFFNLPLGSVSSKSLYILTLSSPVLSQPVKVDGSVQHRDHWETLSLNHFIFHPGFDCNRNLESTMLNWANPRWTTGRSNTIPWPVTAKFKKIGPKVI